MSFSRKNSCCAALILLVTCAAVVGAAGPALAAPPPTGPLIPDTQRSDVALTVTSSGDPATAVVLRIPFTVGSSARSTVAVWDRGTESYTGTSSSSSDWNMTYDYSGTDEVLDARPDGSSIIRATQITADYLATYSNPDHDPGDSFDPTILDGTATLVEYGPARQSMAIYQDPGAPLSPEQAELSSGSSSAMTIPMPATAVGVGATWTWVEPTSFLALDFDITHVARLDAVSADRFTITDSFAVDIPTAANLALFENVTSVSSGSYSGTGSISGSLGTALDYHELYEIAYSVNYSFEDGDVYGTQGATTTEFTETPLATPPEPTVPVSTAPASTSAEMIELFDDTFTLFVAVPSTWTQISSTPAPNGQARLVVSPDLTTFSPNLTMPEAYTTPGVYLLRTEPLPMDPAEAAGFPVFAGCTEQPPIPYADGSFTGSVVVHDRCNGSASRVAVLAANHDSGSHGILVVAVLPEPGDELLTEIYAGLDGDGAS